MKKAIYIWCVLLLFGSGILVEMLMVRHLHVTVPQFVRTKAQDVVASIDHRIHQSHRIPRILHQIWVSRKGDGSPHPLPIMISRFAAEMKRVHEDLGWTYHLWRDELYEMYKDDPYVGKYRSSNMGTETVALLVDRLRVLLLRDYGGVFCDIDAKIVQPFEVLIQRLPFQTTFFVGIRRIEDNDHMVEVAVLGSAPRSRVILGTLSEYATVGDVLTGFPGGGMVARWMAFYFDENTIVFNYHHFYTTVQTNETIVLQDQYQLGSWRSSIGNAYREIWRPETKEVALKILSTCFEVFRTNSVPAWIGNGALMGYARNGTLHPWDDLVDVLYEQVSLTRDIEEQLKQRLTAAGLELFSFWGGFKVFPANKPKIDKWQWSYPFVDLRWYTITADKSTIEYDKKSIPASAVYPVQVVPFEGISVNVPANTNRVVSILFDEDWEYVCKSRNWDRENEKVVHPLTIGCDQVANKHPFNKGPASKLNLEKMEIRTAFLPIWDDPTEATIFELITATIDICESVGIITWLGGNSLLGYARNGTLHPWDDAVDLMIEKPLPNSNVIILSTLEPKLELLGFKITEFWGGFKIYPAKARTLRGFNYGYPAIDLRWYNFETMEGKSVLRTSHGVILPQEFIFPLKDRKLRAIRTSKKTTTAADLLWWFNSSPKELLTIDVKIPNKFHQVLSLWFGANYMEECKSRFWDRTLEHALKQETLPCRDIEDMHAFHPVRE